MNEERPNENLYSLELTPVELKITHTAVKAMLDGFGHEESDVKEIVQRVLAKLPPESQVQSIHIEGGGGNLPHAA